MCENGHDMIDIIIARQLKQYLSLRTILTISNFVSSAKKMTLGMDFFSTLTVGNRRSRNFVHA